jgi:hypothetical protein
VGLFDFFSSKPSDSKIAKAAETVKNAKAIRDDRVASIDFLAHNVDDIGKAIPALLQRFEFSLEHGINDTREKESCFEGIVKHGDKAIPFVLEYLKSTTRIAWPIKLIKKLGNNDDHVIECLLSVLNYQDVSFDQAQTDKNYDILCHLADYKRPGLAEKIAHFLKDPDERVRFATAEALMEQPFEEASAYFEPLLSDQNPDNSRIKQSVVQKYLENQWVVAKPEVFPNAQVIGPVFVAADRRLVVNQQMMRS